jgi:hypothetical protein
MPQLESSWVISKSQMTRRATAFNPDEALPKLFHASSFALNTLPAWTKKARVWACLLIMLALIAHSSDIMDHCPKLETVKFPDDPIDFTPNGIPRHAEACFADWWKTQQPNCGIRLCTNAKDLQFCPVHWLGSSNAGRFGRKMATHSSRLARSFNMCHLQTT